MIRNPNFFKGELKILILKSLTEGPLHGYKLMKKIGENCMNIWKPTAGSLYPALENLKKEELIEIKTEEKGGRNKKVYKITEKGRKKCSEVCEHIGKMEEMYLKYCKIKEKGENFQDSLYLLNAIHGIILSEEIKKYHGTMIEFASLSRQGKISKEQKQKFNKSLIQLLEKISEIIKESKKTNNA